MRRKSNKTCSIEGCEKPLNCKGMCQMHYLRVKRGETDMRLERLPYKGSKGRKWKPDDPRRIRADNNHCKVSDCTRKYYAKGYCWNHYSNNIRTGSPLGIDSRSIYPCKVTGCTELAGKKGLCQFHMERKRNGTRLDRPKGNKGSLNCNWKGGVAGYPNHYEMKKTRKVVLEKANYICEYCGGVADRIHHKDLSKDNHDESNLSASCAKCNAQYRNKTKTSILIRKYGKNGAELAKELNVTRTYISKLHKEGKLVMTPNGVIYPNRANNVMFVRRYGKTAEKIAEELGYSKDKVYRLHRNGRLRYQPEEIQAVLF